jgi:hypothetical protein
MGVPAPEEGIVMTKLRLFVINLALLGFAASAIARGPGGAGRTYDPHTVETVSGEVTTVETIPHAGGRSGGVHLALKTDRETISVHLGPAWYIDKQKLHVARGDKIEVEGSRVTDEGKPAIVARQIKKGNETLTLRDAAGVPAWAGHGGR